MLVNTEYKTSSQNINSGSFVGLYTITPSTTGNSLTDGQIQNELKAQIQAGRLPAASLDGQGNPQTYYAIFFPPGINFNRFIVIMTLNV